jgi:hypothetical protein
MVDKLLQQLKEAYDIMEAGYIDATGIGNRDEQIIRDHVKAELNKKYPGKIKDVIPPSYDDDHKRKIDGWIVFSNGMKRSITIKSRLDKKTGRDIIFEYYKDWVTKKPGRDLLSVADFYVIKTTDNRVIMLDKKTLVDRLNHFVEKFYELTKLIPGTQRWSDGTNPNNFQLDKDYSVVVKLVHDPEDGANKIMCYANPDKFPKVLNIKI